MSVKLVIFDMDGLMIDSEHISKELWRQALEHHGYKMDEGFFSQLLGRNVATARQLMHEHYGPDFDFDTVRGMRTKLMDDHIDQKGIEIKKGLLHLLDKLDQLGIKKCVATSTDWHRMSKILDKLNLSPRFDGFMTGDRVQRGKPDPEIFLKAAELIGFTPEECIVLEDSTAGAKAGYAAKMRTIVIPDIAELDKEMNDKIYAKCSDLEEAAKIIEGLYNEVLAK